MKSFKIKFVKVCSILFMAGVIVSCGEDFLQPKPLSKFMPENTYINKSAMISLLNDCRHYFKQELIGNPWRTAPEYNYTDICIEGVSFLEGYIDLDTRINPYTNTVYNIYIVGDNSQWNYCYRAIKSANVVISRYDKAEYNSETDKNEILAEGYFHRAFWYYRLVHQYGDVPFIDSEITRPTVDLYSTSRKSILNQMITDMEYAVQHLPTSVNFGEVSRAAGYHLLTKLYLSVGRFDDAIRTATEVIEKSGLALMKTRFGVQRNTLPFNGVSYEGNVMWDLFCKENISINENTEGILIAQDRVEFIGSGATTDGSWKNRIWAPNWAGVAGMLRSGPQYAYLLRGQSFIRPSNHTAYTLWQDCGDDLRHKWPNWFPMDSLKYNNPEQANYGQPAQRPADIGDSIRNWFPFQYYKIFVPDELRDPATNNDARGGFTDYYIFRLAETYLLRAEAYWWTNNLEKAKDDINAIRDRAHAPLITTEDVTIDYILDERTRELYTEEPRKTELTRMAFIMAEQKRDGYSTENMHQKNFFYDRVMRRNNFYGPEASLANAKIKMSPFHYLWPVPQADIDANVEGHINQNLGYPGSERNIPPLE